MPNQLKYDPTRTGLIRRKFMVEMRGRFSRLNRANKELLVKDDALGLIYDDLVFQQQVAHQAWRFATDAGKIQAYRRWLKHQVDAGILEVDVKGKPWTATYVESAYMKGVMNAYTQVHAAQLLEVIPFFQTTREAFLRTSFGHPEALSKIELVSTRAFNELRGVTDVMSQQLSRNLAEGLASGKSPFWIANRMTQTIKGITKERAMKIARTEVIYAHAEGQLDSLERLGISRVTPVVEWATAGDSRVCELCEALEGVVLTIAQARGLIPRHPDCRCAWLPASSKRKEPGQIWRRRGVKEAMKESVSRERPNQRLKEARKRSVWLGKEKI